MTTSDIISKISWSSCGTRLAIVRGTKITLLNAETYDVIVEFLRHDDIINDFSWSADGRPIASASDDRTIRIWNTATGEEESVIDGHGDSVTCVSWHPHWNVLASGSKDGTIRIWWASEGEEAAVKESLHHSPDNAKLRSVEWSPDGNRLLVGTDEVEMLYWNHDTGDRLTFLERGEAKFENAYHPYYEYDSLGWAPDGKKIIASGTNRKVGIWEVNEGKQELLLEGTGDAKGIANCVESGYWFLSTVQESQLVDQDDFPMAYYPLPLEHITTHPDNR